MEGAMAPTDFLIPTLAALMFTLVGYGILNSDRQHSETVGEILWTVFCLCASLVILTGAYQLAESRQPLDRRGAVKTVTADGSSVYEGLVMLRAAD